MGNERKLYRNKDSGMIYGVCEGIADYFDMNPIIIRILWIVLSLCAGLGFIFYFIVALLLPDISERR
ncbi:MAG: PspC domain-containing protein [Clostridiales bacterium]|nr:PspC domain-containing protein [Clostridiales bacterium]